MAGARPGGGVRKRGARDGAVEWDAVLPRVVGLLRSGLSPEQAWARAGAPPPEDSADPLERGILAAGAVAARVGAPLASMLAALGSAAADRGDALALREAALAGPRLSARILAWLPLAGLALAGTVDPGSWRVLALTPLGWGLTAAAALMSWLGRTWTARIVAAASRGDPALDQVRVAVPLLRAALASGADLPRALETVGGALGAVALESAGRRLRAGGVPVWQEAASIWAGADAAWEPVAAALEPAWTSGAAPDPALAAAGEALARRARRDHAVGAAEIGVRVALPLTLCQLPAFVAVGVLPVLIAAVGPIAADLGGVGW